MIIILQILYFMNKSINFIRRLHASDVMAAQRTHLETMSTSLNRVVLRKLLFGVIIIKYEFLLNTLQNDFKKLYFVALYTHTVYRHYLTYPESIL